MTEGSGLYRWVLRLAPPRLRRRHGEHMEAFFLDRLREARVSGRLAVLGVWTHAIADIVLAACRERFRRNPSTLALPSERQEIMLGTDVRYAFRSLTRQRLSTSLVLAMLAIGIAANVAVFSLVNGLFLRPFPFPEPDRLVYFNETAPRWNLDVVGINYPDFHQWRQGARLFEGLALFDQARFNLSDERGAERIAGATVTYDFASVLRITPVLGRSFTAEEDRPNAPPVVVIGYGLWQERFGGDRNVIGRTLRLNAVPHTIIGVLPPEADFPGRVRLWVPLAQDPNSSEENYSWAGVGRLKPGVTIEDAQKDLIRAHQPVWDTRDKQRIVSPFVRSLRAQFASQFETTASTLLAAVILLLIVACANVASVMLARALARRREMGIRVAIGASRSRLVVQLFIENLVLATLGGIAGLLLGNWALKALLVAMGDEVPAWTTFGLDGRVMAFSVAVTVGTAFLFGSAPALHAVRGDVRSAMNAVTAGTTAPPNARRTLSLLVGAEFALAAVLLICGGLLLRAYDRVQHVDPGFRTTDVLTFTVALPEATYGDDTKVMAFWDRLIDRLDALPGVASAGLVTCAPLGCHWGTFLTIEGRPPVAAGAPDPVLLYRIASDGYFRAMGIRLKSGRLFDNRDGAVPAPTVNPAGPVAVDNVPRVVIVNESFARLFWPGVDPIGRRVRFPGDKTPWMTVVGLVGDVRHYGLEQPMRPGFYRPLRQAPMSTLTVALRTTVEPATLVSAARGALHGLDPDLPLFAVQTMEEALEKSLTNRAVYSWLLAVFALIALLLALGGTYGVTSYLVTQRTREIGIRIAVGATARHVVGMVLGDGCRTAIMGVVLGLVIGLATGPLIADLLFDVSPRDPLVLGVVGVGALVTALLASLEPARRAAAVEPMSALRME